MHSDGSNCMPKSANAHCRSCFTELLVFIQVFFFVFKWEEKLVFSDERAVCSTFTHEGVGVRRLEGSCDASS